MYNKTKRPFWNQFRNMIQVVYNEDNPDYVKWGYLGSTWGPRDYDQFEKYIIRHLGPKPSTIHRLSRKDQTDGWRPGNLMWRSPKEMSNAMLNNCRWIKYKGKTQSMMQWSEELDISYNTICLRFSQGWPVKKALSKRNFKYKI
jgi:hypothetical protein